MLSPTHYRVLPPSRAYAMPRQAYPTVHPLPRTLPLSGKRTTRWILVVPHSPFSLNLPPSLTKPMKFAVNRRMKQTIVHQQTVYDSPSLLLFSADSGTRRRHQAQRIARHQFIGCKLRSDLENDKVSYGSFGFRFCRQVLSSSPRRRRRCRSGFAVARHHCGSTRATM